MMYSNFMFIDRLLFELSCKNMETRKHTQSDSDEYSIKRNYNECDIAMILT